MPTLAREAELLKFASRESQELAYRQPLQRLSRDHIRYLEEQERQWYAKTYYNVTFAWRNV